MALWFSASAVVPSLAAEFKLSSFAQATLTSAVQVGFVVGCLISAVFGSPIASIRAASSRLRRRSAPSRTRCCWSSIPRSLDAPLLRFVTGVCMAGVYPVGMKLAVDVGERRHGAARRHPRRRADAGLRASASVQRVGRHRLARSARNRVGSARSPPHSDPRGRRRAQSRAAPPFDPHRADRMAGRPAAAREPRLPRSHVGALRDVGVDRRVPERELRLEPPGGGGADVRETGGVRDHRCRGARLHRRPAFSPTVSVAPR